MAQRIKQIVVKGTCMFFTFDIRQKHSVKAHNLWVCTIPLNDVSSSNGKNEGHILMNESCYDTQLSSM